jgi:hypothetical protein
MQRIILLAATLVFTALLTARDVSAGPFAPPAGQLGSDAIPANSPAIQAWADAVESITRGPINITNPAAGLASFGTPEAAVGAAEGNPSNVVSLGDGGQITVRFSMPLADGPGPDLAVFENSFSDSFLELAVVDVSSNGVDFVQLPAVSLTQTATQVGAFGSLDATNLYNLAGKYRGGYGTPFDLAEVGGTSAVVDVANIRFVRITDVVGSIDPRYGSIDSQGHLINDPWPTSGGTSGFDLDGVAALNIAPEPGSLLLWLLACLGLCLGSRRIAGTRQTGASKMAIFHGDWVKHKTA